MLGKNQRINNVAILILVFGSSVLPLPVSAKSTRWQPHFLQRQHKRSHSAGAHLYASSSAVDGTAQGRSADASTGRDLFKKLHLFKSLYQQPQNNATTTAAPVTTTVTLPATDTTTTAITPTNTNTNTATTTRMAMLPTGAGAMLQARVNINGVGIGDESVAGIAGNNLGTAEIVNFRRQQRPLNRRRLGVKKNGNFNVPPIRRKPQEGIGGGGNGFGQQPNRQRVRIITKKYKNKRNKNGGNNNMHRITNNKNNNNNNNNPNPNRFQNIMNAFRLQTPVVYNY